MSVRAAFRPLPTKERLRSVLGAGTSTQFRPGCCAPSVQIGATWGSTECNLCFTPLLDDERWEGTQPVAIGPVCDGQHVFHKFCLRQWVQTNRSDCPDCRRELHADVIQQLGGLPAPEDMDDWGDEDQAFLEELQNAMAEQAVEDARRAEELRQQQLEQRIWWELVQAVRDGVIPRPQGLVDPGGPNPFLDAGIGVVLTRGMKREEAIAGEREKVAQYMPTLTQLNAAVLAVHKLYLYLDGRSSESDAWAYSWRAGDINYVPYNHFSAINFMKSNETMVAMAVKLIVAIEARISTPGALSPGELSFLQNWVVARQVLTELDALDTHARYWTEMREEYGEWARPRER